MNVNSGMGMNNNINWGGIGQPSSNQAMNDPFSDLDSINQYNTGFGSNPNGNVGIGGVNGDQNFNFGSSTSQKQGNIDMQFNNANQTSIQKKEPLNDPFSLL